MVRDVDSDALDALGRSQRDVWTSNSPMSRMNFSNESSALSART